MRWCDVRGPDVTEMHWAAWRHQCSSGACGEVVLHVSYEHLGVRPDECVVGASDRDEPRTRDAVMEHPGVMDRPRPIVRARDDERRTGDLGEAAPAVERHGFLPGGDHAPRVLIRDEATESG